MLARARLTTASDTKMKKIDFSKGRVHLLQAQDSKQTNEPFYSCIFPFIQTHF